MTYLFASCAVIVVDFHSQTSDITNTGNKDVIEKASSDVELLIELWKNERAICDVTFPKYSNADERKVALSRISHEMDDLDTHKSSTEVQFLENVAFSVRYSASFYFATDWQLAPPSF